MISDLDIETGDIVTEIPKKTPTFTRKNLARLAQSPSQGLRTFFGGETSSYFSGNPITNAPRLVQRNLPYNQSRNIFEIKNKYGIKKLKMMHLVSNDFFHVMLRAPTIVSLTALVSLWTMGILIFAQLYIWADARNPHVDCGLATSGDGQTIPWHTAFAFSLETSTTVGYGLPGGSGAFFENCPYVQVTIFFQMVMSMIFNAFLLSFLFMRFARSENRSNQLLFTDKAVIRFDEKGKIVFEVKVYDHDSKHPLIESHVRMYAVHASADRNYSELRIVRPNDELGSTLIASIPTTVTHHIDAYSALLPPKFRGVRNVVNNHGMPLREIDSITGSRDGVSCPVCGELFGTTDRLKKHIDFCKIVEENDEYPIIGTHRELNDEDVLRLLDKKSPTLSLEHIRKYCEKSKIEIVVMVEGINPLTSSTFQALQSYKSQDIVFGGRFVPLFTENNEVDLELFHEITVVGEN